MVTIPSLAECIDPLKPDLVISPDTQVGPAFMALSKSHDALLVMDSKNHFLGVVSPSTTFFSAKFPYSTKAEKCVFMPQRLYADSSMSDAAKEMVARRTYTLPVFDRKEKVVGVVTERCILDAITKNPELVDEIMKHTPMRDPISAPITSSIGKIYGLMRGKDVSRIVLTNGEGKVEAIVSRTDLRQALAQPTPKERFSNKGGRSADAGYDNEKSYREDTPVKNFAHSPVFMAPESVGQNEIIKKLLHASQNSIVVVDDDVMPVGFFSIRDILTALSNIDHHEQLPLNITRIETLTSEEQAKFEDTVALYAQKIHKRHPLMKVDVVVRIQKSSAGHIRDTEVNLAFTFTNGKVVRAKPHGIELDLTLHEGFDEIDRQIEKLFDR